MERDKEEGEEEEERKSEEVEATPSSYSFTPCPPLPLPMYDTPQQQQMVIAMMSQQQLFHMMNNEWQSVLRMACGDTRNHAYVTLVGLSRMKTDMQALMSNEERKQLATASPSTQYPLFYSQGIRFEDLNAPPPVTSKKVGRPSSKRSPSALEGVPSKKSRIVLPAPAAVAPPGMFATAVVASSSSSSSFPPEEGEGENRQVPKEDTRRRAGRPPTRFRDEEE